MGLLVEIFGVVSGIIYLVLEFKHHSAMWYVGIVTAAVYLYLFATQGLYALAGYQLYYILVSVYGICKWRQDSQKNTIINPLSLRIAIVSIVVSAAVFCVIFFLLNSYTNDTQPLLDTLVTVLSFLATYWLSRSYLYQWLLWLIVDAISVYLYIGQGLYPTAFLYILYTAAALLGYREWKRLSVN